LRGAEAVHQVTIDRADGQRIMHVHHAPDRNADGSVRGIYTLITDITRSKRGEQALREREELTNAILTTATDGIITFDSAGTLVAVNPAVEHIFGYNHGELAGRNVTSLIPLLSRETETRHEVSGHRKDGSTVSIDIALSKMEQLGLFTGIIRDITERKESEENLEQYRKNLQVMSSELMLTEERERQRLAEDIHDGLGQAVFRARMKLDRGPLNDESVQEIRTILAEISNTVNTFTHELSPLVLRQLGLWAALGWMAENFQRRYDVRIRIKGSDPDVRLEENVGWVLFRSIREVLTNVAKHGGTNFASVSVRQSDSRLHVEIKDFGKGFDLTTQSHLVGNGHFGLFSIRERLEYIGGAFAIWSSPGEGTKVTLTVPCNP